MRTLRFACVSLFILSFVTPAVAQEKKDAKSLQGQWDVTKMIKRGEEQPRDRAVMTIIFSGNKMMLYSTADQRSFAFKVDSAKKPREIDLTVLHGNFKGQAIPGIYKLDGDTLDLCLPHDKNTTRPDAFESAGRNVPGAASRMLFFLKRVPSQDPKRDEVAKKIHAQLLKALKAKDVDAAMRLVDVPFLDADKGVTKDAKKVREAFTEAIGRIERIQKKVDGPEEELWVYWSYPQFRRKFQMELEEDKNLVKQLDEMKLIADDRVIIGPFLGVVFIRIRDGNAKIIGTLGN